VRHEFRHFCGFTLTTAKGRDSSVTAKGPVHSCRGFLFERSKSKLRLPNRRIRCDLASQPAHNHRPQHLWLAIPTKQVGQIVLREPASLGRWLLITGQLRYFISGQEESVRHITGTSDGPRDSEFCG